MVSVQFPGTKPFHASVSTTASLPIILFFSWLESSGYFNFAPSNSDITTRLRRPLSTRTHERPLFRTTKRNTGVVTFVQFDTRL